MYRILYIGGCGFEGSALGPAFPDNKFKYEAIYPKKALEKLKDEKYDAILLSGPFGDALNPKFREGLEARVKKYLKDDTLSELISPQFLGHYGAGLEILNAMQSENHSNNKTLVYLVIAKFEYEKVNLSELFKQMIPENLNIKIYAFREDVFEDIVKDVKTDLEKAEELNTRI